MGWRSTVATIRMQLQVFARIVEVIAEVHGFSRLGQHRHPSRRRSGDGRHPVEPARAALRRAVAAGVPADRHAGGRCRAGPALLRRRPHHLSGGIGGAGADPVRRRPANQVSKHPHRAGAIDGAGDHRRAADRADHRAGRQICARSELDRGAAGRRRGGIDRCRGGVPAGAHAGPAPAPPRRRDPGSRIRHQRSVRDLSHPDAGRIHFDRRKLALHVALEFAREGRARRRHRRDRRPSGGGGAQSRGAAAGPARALCHHRRAGDLRRGADLARLGISRGLSRRHHHRQPADARA